MVSSHSQNKCLFQQHACLIENTLQNWPESSKCFPKMNGQWPGICFDGSTAKSRFQCIKEAFIAGVFGNESRRLLFTWRLVQQKKAITRHAFWSVMIRHLSFLTIMIISYFITIITQSSISSLHTVWSRKLHPLRTTSGPCACWFLERQEAVGPKAPYAATDKKMKSTARTEKAINNILTNMERHQRSSKHVQTLSGAYCEHRKWMAKVLFYPHWSCVRFGVIVQVWSLNCQDYRRLPLSTRGGCTSIEVFLLFHSAPKIGTHHYLYHGPFVASCCYMLPQVVDPTQPTKFAWWSILELLVHRQNAHPRDVIEKRGETSWTARGLEARLLYDHALHHSAGHSDRALPTFRKDWGFIGPQDLSCKRHSLMNFGLQYNSNYPYAWTTP